jgi:hypothetical protein
VSRSSHKYARIDALASKGKLGSVLVRLMMVVNDMSLAMDAQRRWTEDAGKTRMHRERGAKIYFVRLQISHIFEAMKIIGEIAGDPRLMMAVDRAGSQTKKAFAAPMPDEQVNFVRRSTYLEREEHLSALTIACIAFACMFGGALLGMLFRLPERHLDPDSKDVVRLGMGLLATVSALVLGLLIASAQSTFQTQSNQIKQITANVVLFDNLLGRFGQRAQPTRIQLRRSVDVLIERIWREKTSSASNTAPFEASADSLLFFDTLQELAPQNDVERIFQTRVIQLGIDLAQTRILFAQTDSAIPMPFMAVLISWITVIFASFGLFTRPNRLAITALGVCAFSTSAAIFLILELGHPFSGLMAISSAPLSNALAPLVS